MEDSYDDEFLLPNTQPVEPEFRKTGEKREKEKRNMPKHTKDINKHRSESPPPIKRPALQRPQRDRRQPRTPKNNSLFAVIVDEKNYASKLNIYDNTHFRSCDSLETRLTWTEGEDIFFIYKGEECRAIVQKLYRSATEAEAAVVKLEKRLINESREHKKQQGDLLLYKEDRDVNVNEVRNRMNEELAVLKSTRHDDDLVPGTPPPTSSPEPPTIEEAKVIAQKTAGKVAMIQIVPRQSAMDKGAQWTELVPKKTKVLGRTGQIDPSCRFSKPAGSPVAYSDPQPSTTMVNPEPVAERANSPPPASSKSQPSLTMAKHAKMAATDTKFIPLVPNRKQSTEMLDDLGKKGESVNGGESYVTKKDFQLLLDMNKTILEKLAKLTSLQQRFMKTSSNKQEGKLYGRPNMTLDLSEREAMLYETDGTDPLNYRGIDISDDVNAIFKKNSSSITKFCITFIRYLWGDRNMRFWHIKCDRHDLRPDDIDDEDQIDTEKRGRERVLNLKDPEGIRLLKKVLTRHFEKVVWPPFEESEQIDSNKDISANGKRQLASKLDRAKKTALQNHIEAMVECAKQWGLDARQRKDRSDDSLYWRLLDNDLKPCPRWKDSWEEIKNEKRFEAKDRHKRRRIEREETSTTLRNIRRADDYYDVLISDDDVTEEEHVNLGDDDV